MKKLIIVTAIISVWFLSSCSSTEQCAAYSSITKFKQKTQKHSSSNVKKYSRNKSVKSYGCYNFY